MRLIRIAILFLFSASLTNLVAQTVTVEPVVSTTPTAGNADDPAIWIHPTDPSRSVIIGTDKDAGVYVWDMNGTELQHIVQGTKTNNVDVRYDIKLGSETVDIVAANLRDAGKLAVFKVNPDYADNDVLIQIADKDSDNNDIQGNSYGFGLYRRESDGALFVFDRPKKGGKIRQYLIDGTGSGNSITVTPVRDMNYSGGTAEGFVADDALGFVYFAEEGKAIHKYYADPDQSSDVLLSFGKGDGISGDREGMALYACSDTRGYLVLSSQGNSTVKIYEREGDNKFVKTVQTKDHRGKTGLGTDGLDANSRPAGPNFPNGLLVVHDESGARYHLYDWAQVAESDLVICPESGGGDPGADTTPPDPPQNLNVTVAN